MRITNIKQLEKSVSRLKELLIHARRWEENTADETAQIQIIAQQADQIENQLMVLRTIKNSPPALVVNFLKDQMTQRSPELVAATKFVLDNEETVSLQISSSFLGYNLEHHNREYINQADGNRWEIITDNDFNDNPLAPFIDRLSNLDEKFIFYLKETYDNPNRLCLQFYFKKSHITPQVMPLLWRDVLTEVFGMVNNCRTAQGREPI